VKIGPVYVEIIWLNLKKKKLRKVKYIARSASLPSELNKQVYLLTHKIYHIALHTKCTFTNQHASADVENILLHRPTAAVGY